MAEKKIVPEDQLTGAAIAAVPIEAEKETGSEQAVEAKPIAAEARKEYPSPNVPEGALPPVGKVPPTTNFNDTDGMAIYEQGEDEVVDYEATVEMKTTGPGVQETVWFGLYQSIKTGAAFSLVAPGLKAVMEIKEDLFPADEPDVSAQWSKFQENKVGYFQEIAEKQRTGSTYEKVMISLAKHFATAYSMNPQPAAETGALPANFDNMSFVEQMQVMTTSYPAAMEITSSIVFEMSKALGLTGLTGGKIAHFIALQAFDSGVSAHNQAQNIIESDGKIAVSPLVFGLTNAAAAAATNFLGYGATSLINNFITKTAAPKLGYYLLAGGISDVSESYVDQVIAKQTLTKGFTTEGLGGSMTNVNWLYPMLGAFSGAALHGGRHYLYDAKIPKRKAMEDNITDNIDSS